MSSTELTNWLDVKKDELIVVARKKNQNFLMSLRHKENS